MEEPVRMKKQYFRSEKEMIRTILWAAAGKALILSIFASLLAVGLMKGVFGLDFSGLEIVVTVTGWSVLTTLVVQSILLMRRLG